MLQLMSLWNNSHGNVHKHTTEHFLNGWRWIIPTRFSSANSSLNPAIKGNTGDEITQHTRINTVATETWDGMMPSHQWKDNSVRELGKSFTYSTCNSFRPSALPRTAIANPLPPDVPSSLSLSLSHYLALLLVRISQNHRASWLPAHSDWQSG